MDSLQIPHELDSYYVDNTPEALKLLNDLGYKIQEGCYSNLDYYMEYPYLLVHDGYIQLCHDRHLNRADLYGINKKLELIDGQFLLKVGLGDFMSKVVTIEGKTIDMTENLYDKVTYVPGHAKGNAGHPDCELGVIVGFTNGSSSHAPTVRVLYCKSRNVQHTDPQDLVWG